MSLIVARCTQRSILAVADTKISLLDERVNPYLQGLSKVFFLDSTRLIAFAGDVRSAYSIIGSIDPSFSNQEVIECLSLQPPYPGEQVQFLFGRLSPRPSLVRISNGTASNSDNNWIGDSQAYSLYQERFHLPLKSQVNFNSGTEMKVLQLPQGRYSSDAAVFSKMFDSMKSVIESGQCTTVGGFVTAAYIENDRLKFTDYLSLYRNPIDLSELGHNGVVPFGDERTGSFSVNCAGFGQSGFAIHIAQGRLGIVFRRGRTLILEPVLETNKTEREFETLLHSAFGGGLGIRMEGN